mmetsp:Transcript_6387/g.17175  ORF Transcript_6387/g.17175 Transcript_6387/m.17175 type:complete len:224 (+) Transcript_6387:502-1173(+)
MVVERNHAVLRQADHHGARHHLVAKPKCGLDTAGCTLLRDRHGRIYVPVPLLTPMDPHSWHAPNRIGRKPMRRSRSVHLKRLCAHGSDDQVVSAVAGNWAMNNSCSGVEHITWDERIVADEGLPLHHHVRRLPIEPVGAAISWEGLSCGHGDPQAMGRAEGEVVDRIRLRVPAVEEDAIWQLLLLRALRQIVHGVRHVHTSVAGQRQAQKTPENPIPAPKHLG